MGGYQVNNNTEYDYRQKEKTNGKYVETDRI
jgi:hypothetical protein